MKQMLCALSAFVMISSAAVAAPVPFTCSAEYERLLDVVDGPEQFEIALAPQPGNKNVLVAEDEGFVFQVTQMKDGVRAKVIDDSGNSTIVEADFNKSNRHLKVVMGATVLTCVRK